MELNKLTLFEPDEIKQLFEDGEITIDFLGEYISKHNKTYNMLIDIANNVNVLKEELEVMYIQGIIPEYVKNDILKTLEGNYEDKM